MSVAPRHGLDCTIGPGGVCMSAHCQWCGRPHSMWTACGCEWSKRQVERPALPHIYLDGGRWWVAREGRVGLPHMSDAARPSFPEACYLAMLAAISAGVWRA